MGNKEKIAKAALFLSIEHGFDNVSIKQIQEKSGLASGSIYYYFKDKDDILEYIVVRSLKEAFDNYTTAIKNSSDYYMGRIKACYRFFLGTYSGYEDTGSESVSNIKFIDFYLSFISIFHEHFELRQIFLDHGKKLLEFHMGLVDEAKEKGELSETIDSKKLAVFIMSSLRGFVDVWMRMPDFGVERIIDSNLNWINRILKVQNHE